MLAPMWAASASTLTPKSIRRLDLSTRVFSTGSSIASLVSGQQQPQLDGAARLEAELASGAGSDELLVAELEADRLRDAVLALPRQVEPQLGAAVVDQAEVDGRAVAERGLRHGEGVLERGRRRGGAARDGTEQLVLARGTAVSSAGAVPSCGARVRVWSPWSTMVAMVEPTTIWRPMNAGVKVWLGVGQLGGRRTASTAGVVSVAGRLRAGDLRVRHAVGAAGARTDQLADRGARRTGSARRGRHRSSW